MVNTIPQIRAPSPSGFNVFDTLPNEIIQGGIAPYLLPNDMLSLRLSCRRFAQLFGDTSVWRIYYQTIGLKSPTTGLSAHPLSLAKALPFWTSLQRVIGSRAEKVGDIVYCLKTRRSLCIVALTMPELAPLHTSAIKMLHEIGNVSNKLPVDELFLRVARKDQDFKVEKIARGFAIKELSKRAENPAIQQLLLSFISVKERWMVDEHLCSEAVRGLLPYLSHERVRVAVLSCLRIHGRDAVLPALGILIIEPEFLSAVMDEVEGGYSIPKTIIQKHLNNKVVVSILLQRLSTTNSGTLLGELARVLKPIANEDEVQRALCQRLVNLQDGRGAFNAYQALLSVIQSVELTRGVKEEFQGRLPMLQELERRENISRLNPLNTDHRQQLLKALSSKIEAERVVAATLLAPLVPDDPEILSAFKNRIYAKDFSRIGIVLVSAVAMVAKEREIRNLLIEEGCLDGRLGPTSIIDHSALRLATVKALLPFSEEPEVRKAYIKRLKLDESSDVRCALIDILAPQLDREDVKKLFLEAALDKLHRKSYYSGPELQVAAIDKLGSIVDDKEVKAVLLHLFEKSTYLVKNACMRALCRDYKKRLIEPSKIFLACLNESIEVRMGARLVLAEWVRGMHNDS